MESACFLVVCYFTAFLHSDVTFDDKEDFAEVLMCSFSQVFCQGCYWGCFIMVTFWI